MTEQLEIGDIPETPAGRFAVVGRNRLEYELDRAGWVTKQDVHDAIKKSKAKVKRRGSPA